MMVLSQTALLAAVNSHMDSLQLKILHVTNMWPTDKNPTKGSFVVELVEALRRQGGLHDVFAIDASKSGMEYLYSVNKLKKWIMENGPYSLIHAQYAHSAMVSLLAARIPVIFHVHGEFGYKYYPVNLKNTRAVHDWVKTKRDALLAKLASRLSNGTIVVNRADLAFVSAKLSRVIPIGVDTEVFRPMDRSEACLLLGLDPSVRRVLFPSDPDRPEKNYSLFRASLQLLKERGCIFEEVLLKGYTRSQVALLMNAVDVMVLTSYSEASPTVVKEACLCNLPIVSVPVGDVAELMENKCSIHVVKPSSACIQEALYTLFQTGKRSSCSEETKRKFSIELSAELTKAFYSDVLESPV